MDANYTSLFKLYLRNKRWVSQFKSLVISFQFVVQVFIDVSGVYDAKTQRVVLPRLEQAKQHKLRILMHLEIL